MIYRPGRVSRPTGKPVERIASQRLCRDGFTASLRGRLETRMLAERARCKLSRSELTNLFSAQRNSQFEKRVGSVFREADDGTLFFAAAAGDFARAYLIVGVDRHRLASECLSVHSGQRRGLTCR